jgi:hypothetical protein
VVFPLQEWWIVTCRPTSLRVTLDLPNGWKHRDNLWTDLGRPSQNNWRFCWFVWCVLEFLPTKFEQGIANEKSCSKFVPHVLTADQNQSQVDACRELKLEIDPDLFSKVITGDDVSWCYAYDPETSSEENVLRTWKRWRKKWRRH